MEKFSNSSHLHFIFVLFLFYFFIFIILKLIYFIKKYIMNFYKLFIKKHSNNYDY